MDRLASYTKKIVAQPPALTAADLYDAINIVIELLTADTNYEDMDYEYAKYAKVASFLSCLRTSGLDHKAEYIAEAARAVLNFSSLVDLPSHSMLSSRDATVMDIVGTGGDGQNTFNVSTSSAIVASGIPGLKICKHGGKASTSNSGAGDLISTLGCDVASVNASTVPSLWENNTFLFLLAPFFHNGMGAVAKLRKLLAIPTIFNVLGPLLHPVDNVNKRVLGVYSKDLALEYARAAAMVYPDSETFVVWGHVGLDEVSPTGKTTVWHVRPQFHDIDIFQIEPKLFGLVEHPLSHCLSMGPRENASILKNDILSAKYKLGDNHPIYDYILLNTAVLYCLSQGNKDWKMGVQMAEKSIQSGNAMQSLLRFINSVKDIKESNDLEKVPLKKIN